MKPAYFICNMPYAVFQMKYGVWHIAYGLLFALRFIHVGQ